MWSCEKVSWNSVLLCLLLLSSPAVAGDFNTREDCDKVLGDFRRNANSKYLYPSDWNKWNGVSAEIGANSAKEICGSYGLLMPSAYHIKDWLSLQEIVRNYVASVAKPHPYPFFIGDKINSDGTISDSSGDKVETFILWSKNEPSGDGQNVALDVLEDASLGLYFAGANDIKDTSAPKESGKMGGKLVCMYPKGSFCFEESTENLEFRRDASVNRPLFLGRVLESFYLWINLRPRFPDAETIEGDCREPRGEKPEGVTWLSDLTTFETDEGPVITELFENTLPKLGLISYTWWGFGSADGMETFYWNPSTSSFDKWRHGHKTIQQFTLCVYRFPTESCPST